LEDTLDTLDQNLRTEILDILSGVDPSLFEFIIGELLKKMRYGEVHITGRSGDGGIDGTCSIDALGLYKVHFQAKRWKNQVGSKEIRDFIGGIQAARGEYGIFVSTSDFSQDAVETAKKSGKVRLVNGREFAGLMIQYELGVSKTHLHLAKIDKDYFEGL
jgi:restriction system protein